MITIQEASTLKSHCVERLLLLENNPITITDIVLRGRWQSVHRNYTDAIYMIAEYIRSIEQCLTGWTRQNFYEHMVELIRKADDNYQEWLAPIYPEKLNMRSRVQRTKC